MVKNPLIRKTNYTRTTSQTGKSAGVLDDFAVRKVVQSREIYGSNIIVFINHGAVAATSRPNNAGIVQWIGSVEPTNAITGDIWIDTST